MKTRLLFIVLILATGAVFAQSGAPQKIKYQAVVRDPSGAPFVGRIGMQVTLYQYAADETLGGKIVYQERHELKSNAFGLVNFAIGAAEAGNVEFGQFNTLVWSDGPYFIKLEVDIDNTGWTNMTELSTVELMSVPYALYAETSGSSATGGGGNVDLSHLSDRTVPFYDVNSANLQDSKIRQSENNDTIATDAHIATPKTIQIGTTFPVSMAATSNGSFGIGRDIDVSESNNDYNETSVFAIGRNDTIEEGQKSFNVGMENKIKESQNIALIGMNNEVDKINDATYVFGSSNKILNSIGHLTVLGEANDVDDTYESMILGEQNTAISSRQLTTFGRNNSVNSEVALILGDGNELSNDANNSEDPDVPGSAIIVGHNNNSENTENNILVGRSNAPTGNHNIVVGQNNKPNTRSIFIGTNNDNDGGQADRIANIVMGSNNFLKGGNASRSIVIGNNISAVNDFSFPRNNTINIGNDIRPHVAGGARSHGDNSINIGQNITTASDKSISIGTDIEASYKSSGTSNFFGTISIGNNIQYNRNGCIVLGQNNELKYPPTSMDPKFVVGNAFPEGTRPDYHLLLITSESKAYFGASFNGSNTTPAYALNSGVYARQYFSPSSTISNVNASDRRLKSNIKPFMGNYTDYLYKIRPFTFNYINDETQRLEWGFMAQDVQNYFPNLVVEMEDGTLGLGYMGFIPILWKIAQDQQTQIDEQQMRIEELERKVDLLLQKIGE